MALCMVAVWCGRLPLAAAQLVLTATRGACSIADLKQPKESSDCVKDNHGRQGAEASRSRCDSRDMYSRASVVAQTNERRLSVPS